MPGTSTRGKLPYPLPSEPVSAGADSIRKLAQSVDNMVQAGTVSMDFTALNSNVDVNINFAVAFASAPFCYCGMITGFPQNYVVSILSTGLTASGCTIRGRQISGGLGAINVHWIAVGPVATVA